jgi:hypothetical protein
MVTVRARIAMAVDPLAAVIPVLAFIAFLPVGFAAAFITGPDVHVQYLAGDEPTAEPDARSWTFGPGAEASTSYATTRRHTRASVAGSLRLDTSTCDLARVDWTITADGDRIGQGTLSARDWRYDLEDLELPRGHTPSALLIAARRADEADCDAELMWYSPSFDVPGIGPVWPTELSTRQIFLTAFITVAGVVVSLLLYAGLMVP